MKPSAERILVYLRNNRNRAVPAPEICNSCFSLDYRKRISELKREGYVITSKRVQGKPYNAYRLILEAQEGGILHGQKT